MILFQGWGLCDIIPGTVVGIIPGLVLFPRSGGSSPIQSSRFEWFLGGFGMGDLSGFGHVYIKMEKRVELTEKFLE